MKKFTVKISALFAAALLLFTAVGCSLFSRGKNLPGLAVPEITVSDSGVAQWGGVEHAIAYVYVVDGGGEKQTQERRVLLSDGQSVRVKAVGDGKEYADSEFSQPKQYVSPVSPTEHLHADFDGNGICDGCGESVTAELSFYAVNDLHGKYMDTDRQPGVDEFTAYLKALYADKTREEILLSSGDMWQGTVESSTNKGRLMTEWMNEVGFVSMTLGNHEYDWGAATLTPNSELAEFPFLAINVTYRGKAVDYCRASTVVEKGGVKIGIIGAIGDCLSSISGDFTDGLQFATGDALTALVKNEAVRLRGEEQCDFIVYSVHDGYGSSVSSSVASVTNGDISYYDTALSDGYVDLVFEGHTHQSYILKDEYGVYHLQGGGENNYVSCAEVSFNTVTHGYAVTPRILSNRVYASDSVTGDPVVGEIFEKYFPEDNPYTAVLGTNDSRKNDGDICEQVAKLYYSVGTLTWGASYNIVSGGGYLKTSSPYSVAAGGVTYASLFSVLPFDNEIVLGRIRGVDLKAKFLGTSNANYHVYSTISPSEVSNGKDYYIIVDSYTSTYAPNRITEIARLKNGKYARDLLADFISEGGWSAPKSSLSGFGALETYAALTEGLL